MKVNQEKKVQLVNQVTLEDLGKMERMTVEDPKETQAKQVLRDRQDNVAEKVPQDPQDNLGLKFKANLSLVLLDREDQMEIRDLQVKRVQKENAEKEGIKE